MSKAIEGYFLEAQARQLSPNTLHDYGHTFKRLREFFGRDPLLPSIDRTSLVKFLASLSTAGWSKKSVLNAHIALSALWQWLIGEGLVPRNIVRDIKPPRPEVKAIEPFMPKDIERLLAAAAQVHYQRAGQRPTQARATMAARNRAIVLVLLDTCMRSAELCALTIGDVDLQNRRIRIRSGKGGKERYVSFVAETGRSIWRYLSQRDPAQPGEPLFSTAPGHALRNTELSHILKRLGERAGVQNCHAHRFRHTGAIQHLIGGMNVFSLREMLGHESISTTQRYIYLAGLNTAEVHQQSSAVARWKVR